MLLKLLVQIFVTISEKVFLRWYESAKEKQKNDIQAHVNGLSDTDIADELRKYRRD